MGTPPRIEKRIAYKGQIVLQVLIFGSIAIYFVGAFATWAVSNIKASKQSFDREQAIQIAEAGIDYYRWHLAHAPTDYQDGTGVPGPYVHDFRDKNGNVIGQFSLTITPPPLGSTLVAIRSAGTVTADPTFLRTIATKLAKPSFGKYAWILNDFVHFGSTAEVFGPIHSNVGIRFDGLAHNLVSSGVSTYDDPGHGGAAEFGVHTHDPPTDPLPPAAVPDRPDVFEVGRQFPLPVVGFDGLIGDLATLRTDAISGGGYYGPSGGQGYHIILQTDDRYDIYRVNSLVTIGSCTDQSSPLQPGWGIWSINTAAGSETLVAANVPFPANGIIFTESNVWVDGQIDGARLTIAAGEFPDNPLTRRNIIVNNNLRYTNYDGQDVIGLIAQNNFIVGLRSENDLTIDGAIIAQNGRIIRFNYNDPDCGSWRIRTRLTTHGMLGSNGRSAFFYGGSGYSVRVYNYDANLLYSPPPSFPLTSDQYITLSWEEE